VEWKAKNEQNYTLFTVERSNDAGVTFNTIVGSMRSNAQGNYSLLDKYPLDGANFYRLKQVDINGNITYSKVARVEYSGLNNYLVNENLNVYPNPAKGNINLSIKESPDVNSTAYHIRISNSMGLVVKDFKLQQPNWQGSVSDLLTGTYVIEVVNAKDQTLIGKTKFVKL
jgi:hypothetical protein